MISTTMSFLMVLLMLIMINSMNPVKASMTLLFYSLAVLTKFYFNLGSSWVMMLMMLLFMGGILMMFMILASMMPNEKMFKGKTLKIFMLAPLLVYPMITKDHLYFSESVQKMKLLMECNTMILFSTAIIILYFFFFILMLSKEKFSMRTYS